MRTWWRGSQTSLWRAWHLKLSLRNGTRGVKFQAKSVRKASKQKMEGLEGKIIIDIAGL